METETYVSIPEFYAGKSVFITGGSGFLGKVLLEKLLYSCPQVGNVYLLLRDKNTSTAEQRLQAILNLPIFIRLKKERPQDLNKIVLLKGDISVENLNLKAEDLNTIVEKVSVVIHSAATVKFNDPLKDVLKSNFEGTKNVLNLCHLMKKIKVFVHISTAYSNADKPVVEEIVYPPPAPIDEVYKFVEQEDVDETETAKFLNGKPNTYTFTKALAEHLVSETHGDIPTVIIRPSIVTPAKNEPVPGWVDNWYGATGLLTAFAKGICRVVYTTDDHILDLIPVDYVSNLTLIAAAKTTKPSEVAVYNSCSGSTNPISVRNLANMYSQNSIKHGFNSLPHPHLIIFTKRYWLVEFISFLKYCVAYIVDFFSYFFCIKTRYLKHVSQAVMIRRNLDYFTSNSWLFKSNKSLELYKTLSPSDASLFPCLARDIDWKKYISIYFQGVKKYLIEKKRE